MEHHYKNSCYMFLLTEILLKVILISSTELANSYFYLLF